MATYAWTSGQPFYAYEGNLTIPAGTTLTLVPGVYFFVNASLTMLNGSTVQCRLTASGAGACAPGNAGVTIVLLGNPASSVGNLTIQPTATVVLGALNSQTGSFSNSIGLGPGYTALNGILFYRRGLGRRREYRRTGRQHRRQYRQHTHYTEWRDVFPQFLCLVWRERRRNRHGDLRHPRRRLSEPDQRTEPVQFERLRNRVQDPDTAGRGGRVVE